MDRMDRIKKLFKDMAAGEFYTPKAPMFDTQDILGELESAFVWFSHMKGNVNAMGAPLSDEAERLLAEIEALRAALSEPTGEEYW